MDLLNNPQKRTAIKLHFQNARGKNVKLNNKNKVRVYYSVGKSKKLVPLGRYGRRKYKNQGDYINKLKDQARSKDLSLNKINKTKTLGAKVWSGSYGDPSYKTKKQYEVPFKKINVTSKKSNRKKDVYRFKSATKYNQKYLFENMGFDKYLKKKYKKVGVKAVLTFKNLYINKNKMFNTLKREEKDVTIKVNVKDIKKHIKGFTRKWKNVIKKDITMSNFIYYALLKELKKRAYHFSPKARRYNSGTKGKRGKKYDATNMKKKTIKIYDAHIEFEYN